MAHVGVHRCQVDQKLLWLKVESLRVLDLELQTSLCRQLVEAEVDCLSKLSSKLFGNKGLLALVGDLCKELDDHVYELEVSL